MLFNEARATALLQEAGVDAIVAAAPISVDYLTDHRSSFETTFRRYHMIPGGVPSCSSARSPSPARRASER